MEDIREGLSVGQATAADGHWTKWAYFCARVALDPLLVAYKYPIPILNAFAQDYRTGNITPNSCGVRSRTVEDAVRSIGQVVVMLGAKDPRITFRWVRSMGDYSYISTATPGNTPLPLG